MFGLALANPNELLDRKDKIVTSFLETSNVFLDDTSPFRSPFVLVECQSKYANSLALKTNEHGPIKE